MTSSDDRQGSVRPASRRMADDLRERITSGAFAADGKLPSERDLAEHYATARNTAREAIRILADEGLVTAHHGRGVFVRPVRPLLRLGNDRYSSKYRDSGQSPFLIECAKQGKIGSFQVLAIERIKPPAEAADRLKVSGRTRSVLRRENVFYADADPVQKVTTYIPWTIAEGSGLLEEVVPHPYGIHGVLEDQGYVMARLREEISARMPQPEERQYLQLPPGVPVIDVLHTSLDDQERPYELTRFVMRADLSGLYYDVPVE
jgi:GntR family transcriptional regulator